MEDPKLIDSWLSAKNEKERAIAEQEIWEQAREPGRSRREYLASLLSVPPSQVEWRALILNLEGASEILWQRIHNKELPMSMAVRLIRQAKQLKGPISETLPKILRDYDNVEHSVLINGIPVRKYFTSKIPPSTAPEDSFWKRVRIDVKSYLQEETKDFPPPLVADVNAMVMVELDSFLKTIQTKLYQARGKAKGAETVQRILRSDVRITEACATLHLDRPRKFDEAFRKKAVAQKRLLVRAYHPDVAGPSANQEKYQAVIDAFNTLDAFMASNMNTETPGD